MQPSSNALLDRLGLRDGHVCLDVGCGGGDITLELARRVGPSGRAVGFDMDPTLVQIARDEATQHGVSNVEFDVADVRRPRTDAGFDVVYARFLLTHVGDPAAVLTSFHDWLRPGGVVAVEDIDFSGHFTCPESEAFQRYHRLYCSVVTRRGGDPNIGLRLPALLKQCGFDDIDVHVVQPVAMQGPAKLMNPLTMENIAAAVLADRLATQDEIDALVRDLYEFAENPDTVAGPPRVIQACGRRPERS